MSSPTVSIVIVNWKTPDLLAGCLDSLKKDPGDFEIWVIDNNSSDGSLQMLSERFPYVKVIANSKNLGFSKACNQAIPQCSGRYVLLLNPDTVVSGSAVSILANYMDAHPSCGAVGPAVLNPDGALQPACRRSFPTPAAAFFRVTYLSKLFPKSKLFGKYNLSFADEKSILEVDSLSGSCMMVRQEIIKKIGLLEEKIFMFGEEIDWCWRIKLAGYKVIYLPDAIIYHFHGASSRLRPVGATINLHKGMEVFYRKHLAPKYWAPFNWLVYAAIWLRAAIFIVLGSVQSLFGSKKPLAKLDYVLPSEDRLPETARSTAAMLATCQSSKQQD